MGAPYRGSWLAKDPAPDFLISIETDMNNQDADNTNQSGGHDFTNHATSCNLRLNYVVRTWNYVMTRIGHVYRWVRGRMEDRPINFSWIIRDKLAGSGMPMTYSQFRWVIARGIRAIVTVREVPLPVDWLSNFYNGSNNYATVTNIDILHVRVEDYGAPSLEELDNTIDYIKRHIEKENPVMVHCAAGKGRTGTVLAAYLLKEQKNLHADEAISNIRKLRPGSVQSENQQKCVEAYEHYLTRYKRR